MSIRQRIGLVYVSGALPCFENFGNLPTDLVRADGFVDGRPASEVLDMLIVPGGSLIESGSVVNSAVSSEILKMSQMGKFVFGVCSGFQVLGRRTVVERLSSIPLVREGLGLLDVEFSSLVCTDRVRAKVVGESFLGGSVGDSEVFGFHCHTYGRVILGGDAAPMLVSSVEHVNYRRAPQDLVSGVTNKKGNVVGVFVHGLLDQNCSVLDGVLHSLDISPVDLVEIRKVNAQLVLEMKREVGVNSNVSSGVMDSSVKRVPMLVLVTALGSGSGKTFLVTGMAGALCKRGFNVGLVKVGGDVRDCVPALYLVKGSIKDYSSIKIGGSGWSSVSESMGQACGVHDFLFVEGAMSVFTGLLNGKANRPASTLEVAVSLSAPVIVVVTCDKEGIEGGLVNVLNYVKVLKMLGVHPVGVILNKMSTSYLSDEDRQTISLALERVGVTLLGVVPSLKFERREMIPEVEICYETFGVQAMDIVERYIDLDLLVSLANAPKLVNVDYEVFVERFKQLLINYSGSF